ncbi:hypothetical protein [Flavobacterium sp. FlaQc-47]|uniref:hypothetical protein n=1 Tax=Flavobacterium sp. FlaQc-47 TaxID=3374180 RepID=UPI003756DCE2
MKYYKSIILVGLILVLYACEYIGNHKKYKQINSNIEFDFIVYQIESENGYILNKEYYYSGGVFLQKNNNSKNLILQNMTLNDGTILIDDDGQILLDIYKIKRPFQLYKKKNSNVLSLIKDNDTLKFRIN